VALVQEAGLFTSPIVRDEPNAIVDAPNTGLLSVLAAVVPVCPKRVKPHCETFLFTTKLQKCAVKSVGFRSVLSGRMNKLNSVASRIFLTLYNHLLCTSEDIFLF